LNLLPLFLVAGLVMMEPDLGTTIIICLIGLSQIFISGVNLFSYIGIIGGSGILGTLLIMISSYRRERLLSYIKALTDPLGSSYHIRQVLLGLGLGGLTGVGLGQSRQKFLFLPEAATDSIFAVIAEEVGFIGSFILLALFFCYLIFCFRISLRAPDKFSQSLAVGLTAWIGFQTILNLGSMIALTPLTGIPLPFFSYGGSSLIMIMLSTGILLNISRFSVSFKHGRSKK